MYAAGQAGGSHPCSSGRVPEPGLTDTDATRLGMRIVYDTIKKRMIPRKPAGVVRVRPPGRGGGPVTTDGHGRHRPKRERMCTDADATGSDIERERRSMDAPAAPYRTARQPLPAAGNMSGDDDCVCGRRRGPEPEGNGGGWEGAKYATGEARRPIRAGKTDQGHV